MYRMVTVIAMVAAVLAVGLLRGRFGTSSSRPRAEASSRFPWIDSVVARVCGAAFLGLVLTGFYDVLVMNRAMHGWVLLAHVGFGGLFTAVLLAFTVLRAEANAPGAVSASSGLRKACFWIFAASGLALVLTASLAMIPWLGTVGQVQIVVLHRWAALVAVVAAIGYVGFAARRRLAARPAEQEKAPVLKAVPAGAGAAAVVHAGKRNRRKSSRVVR